MVRILPILLIAACMIPQPKLVYADGSANRYEISAHELVYVPVRPETSSTGRYSGGEPATVELSAAQYRQLKTLFEDALAQTDQQQTDRIKTSGWVLVEAGELKREAVLKPDAATKQAIEAELKKILGRE